MGLNEGTFKKIAEETGDDDALRTFIVNALVYESSYPTSFESQYESFLKTAVKGGQK